MTSTESITPIVSAVLSSDFLLAAKDGFLQSQSARTVAWVLGLLVVMGTAWGASAISGSIRRKERAKQSSKKTKPKGVLCRGTETSLNAPACALGQQKQARQFIDNADYSWNSK